MAEPYTIHIFVVDGDPDGVKIVDREIWTGIPSIWSMVTYLVKVLNKTEKK